jgi:MFS family permease
MTEADLDRSPAPIVLSAPISERRIHPAWWVAAVTFLALVGAAAFRAVPGLLIDPLRAEFGWSVGTISLAVATNMALYGLTAPFAAALMERFGIRRVVMVALLVVSAGSGFTVFMTAAWQLVLCWGLLVGLGTGSMAMALVATVTGRWFVARRGLVSGVLTAGGAAGQLVFLPVVAVVSERYGWRPAALGVAGAALAVVPLVAWWLRDRPRDLGVGPYGGTLADDVVAPPVGAGRLAARTLVNATRTGPFWLLAGGFMICGATTAGLIQPHFVPAAHDHGMPHTVAAGLLAVVGVFDIVGTVASGWLTDRFDPRSLLLVYYALRGLALLGLPPLFGPEIKPSMLAFVIFYGLDWVATVPPTLALCRDIFGPVAPVVFGWVFASHQVGAAMAAFLAGLIRDHLGSYDLAWYAGGTLSVLAGGLSMLISRRKVQSPDGAVSGSRSSAGSGRSGCSGAVSPNHSSASYRSPRVDGT